ncbi:class I SAM-dependent methyltransferase [Candidatus Woesearchaeota archaeon]|nr:class I SAM-dependent methyltransferase [Candidatus Woesearchaeota archaeon]
MANLRFSKKEEFLEKYEKDAETYDQERSLDYEGRRVDEVQTELIYSLIKKNRCRKILEAGCGTGRVLLPLAEKGLECHGFDPSRNMLAQFRKKMASKKLGVKLKQGDIEKIPYKDNTFDCVFTMHVLMHLPTGYKKAFKEMYRVTKKGGLVICDFPNKDSMWTKLALLTNPKKKRTQLFKINELKKFFKKYEYKVTGLFSYARTFYKIPILRNVFSFLDKNLPLPIRCRTQLIFIVKKR